MSGFLVMLHARNYQTWPIFLGVIQKIKVTFFETRCINYASPHYSRSPESPTHDAIAAFVGRISIVGRGNSDRHQVATGGYAAALSPASSALHSSSR